MFYEAKCVLCYVCNIYKTKTATRKNSNYYYLHFNVYHFISVTYCLPNFLFFYFFVSVQLPEVHLKHVLCELRYIIQWHDMLFVVAVIGAADDDDDDVNEELNKLLHRSTIPAHATAAACCCISSNFRKRFSSHHMFCIKWSVGLCGDLLSLEMKWLKTHQKDFHVCLPYNLFYNSTIDWFFSI